jgi:hypothetical protein
MQIPKHFLSTAIIDYHKQLLEKLPGHRLIVDGLPCRVGAVDVEKQIVIFETVGEGA